MKNRLTAILFILLVVLFTNCDLESDCYNQAEVPVSKIEMPDSIPIDSTAKIKITYEILNNCNTFAYIQDYTYADTISLHVIATFEGCECPSEAPDSVLNIIFNSSVARDYIFRALKIDGSILQDTLIVYDQNQ